MFNGLIREIAEVVDFNNNKLRIKSTLKPKIGDSIAVNGACLSVTNIFNNGFEVELSEETRKVIAVDNLRGRVHIEPAMKLNEQIDGHIVQGHIDGIGEIKRIEQKSCGRDFFIKIPKDLMPLMAHKGSIAIDGVSLTISDIFDPSHQIRISVIPITLSHTLFGEFKPGRIVNIESDVLARYVARILNFKKGLTWSEVERISSLY